jgi:hypothetical protein
MHLVAFIPFLFDGIISRPCVRTSLNYAGNLSHARYIFGDFLLQLQTHCLLLIHLPDVYPPGSVVAH